MSDKFEGFPLSTTIFKDTKPEDPELAKHMRQARTLLHELKYRNQNTGNPLEVIRRLATIEGVDYDVSTVFGIDKVRIIPPKPPKLKPVEIEEPVFKPVKKRTDEEIWEEDEELGLIEVVWAILDLQEYDDQEGFSGPDEVPDPEIERKFFDRAKEAILKTIPEYIPLEGIVYQVVFTMVIGYKESGATTDTFTNLPRYSPFNSYASMLENSYDDFKWYNIDIDSNDEDDGGWYVLADGPESLARRLDQIIFTREIIRRFVNKDKKAFPIKGLSTGDEKEISEILGGQYIYKKYLLMDLIQGYDKDSNGEQYVFYDDMFGDDLNSLMELYDLRIYWYLISMYVKTLTGTDGFLFDTRTNWAPLEIIESSPQKGGDGSGDYLSKVFDFIEAGGATTIGSGGREIIGYYTHDFKILNNPVPWELSQSIAVQLSDHKNYTYYDLGVTYTDEDGVPVLWGYGGSVDVPIYGYSDGPSREVPYPVNREIIRVGVYEDLGVALATDIQTDIYSYTNPDLIDLEPEMIATYTVNDEVYYREEDPVTRIIEI